VFPVAAAAEKAGSFLNWEGRARPFARALRTTGRLSDASVLSTLADAMDAPIGLADLDVADRLLAEFDGWAGNRAAAPEAADAPTDDASEGLRLVTWKPLLGHGALQQGEPYLAATARETTVLLGREQAEGLGVDDGDWVTVHHAGGDITGQVVVVQTAPNTVAVVADATPGSSMKSGDRVTVSVPARAASGGSE